MIRVKLPMYYKVFGYQKFIPNPTITFDAFFQKIFEMIQMASSRTEIFLQNQR